MVNLSTIAAIHLAGQTVVTYRLETRLGWPRWILFGPRHETYRITCHQTGASLGWLEREELEPALTWMTITERVVVP